MGAPSIGEIPGWLTQAEADELHKLAHGRRCLEVGSYCGRSSVAIGTAAARLDCIDPFDGRATPVPRSTLGVFRENVSRYKLGAVVTPYPMTLANWASISSVKSFDFIFLDGDHTAEAVATDLETIAPYASRGGVVAVHDYGNADFPGVAVACESFFHRAPDRVTDSLAVYLMDGPPPGRLLNVVTPVSRPQNLELLSESVSDLQRALPGWVVRWYVSLDRRFDYVDLGGVAAYSVARQSPGGGWGNAGRNDAIDSIRAGWVCFLDDDNAFHSDFAPGLCAAVRERPEAVGYTFTQVKADDTERLAADAWRGSNLVDTAQFVFRRGSIGAHRWPLANYDSDGRFFAAVARDAPPVAVAGLVYYNKLRNE